MTPLALGLMSGTSADGVSAALGDFQGRRFKLLGHLTHHYPGEVAARILKGENLTAREISRLNVELGEIFALTARLLLKKLHRKPEEISCIGSHGQTLYHGPEDSPKNTLQIADPAVIAENTGISVVSHFRERDIALGGEGAPLVPYFDHIFFGRGPVRAFLNIGGIANVALVGKGIDTPLAFDTGPGNALMDLAVRILSGGRETHDHNGQRAKEGTIDLKMIERMMKEPFFAKAPPKSTGRELFGEKFLKNYCAGKLASEPNTILATLNYFTCLTIQESFRKHIFKKIPVAEIVVSGGGLHNKTMMKKLECLFAPIPVKSIDTLGIPAQAKEPLAFAFFGLRHIHRQINHLPEATGAKAPRVLGRLTRV